MILVPARLRRAFCVGAALLAGAASPGMAQGYDQFCLDTVADWCDGRTVTECFEYSGYWQALPEECVADVESMIEDERDYFVGGGDGMADDNYDPDSGFGGDGLADGNFDPGVANGQGYMLDGFSWGGNLRNGPGGQFASIAVLEEGVPLQVIAPTDIYFNGYPWFLVYDYTYGEGYQWGGIICTRGDMIDGISGYC